MHETLLEKASLSVECVSIVFKRRFNGSNVGFEPIAFFCVALFHYLRVQEVALLLHASHVFSNCGVHSRIPLSVGRHPQDWSTCPEPHRVVR
jgi:hypothetical protein